MEYVKTVAVVIKNKDSLMADNEFISYNKKSGKDFKILVVSETPFFFEAAFDALTDSVVDTVAPDEYLNNDGYGLYIFHSYTPEELPDAAVWLVNSHKSVDDSGFSIAGAIELDTPIAAEKTASTSTQARKLLNGVDGRNIFISEYTKCSRLYTKFTTLFSHQSNPLIMAGVNALGNREVVFAFDLHTNGSHGYASHRSMSGANDTPDAHILQEHPPTDNSCDSQDSSDA